MQRPGGGQTRFAEAEHGHRQIGEEAEIDTGSGHRDSRPPYLSLRVARPARARIEAMIQKRITMVGSAQPFFSKWWCSGAMRKTRLPVILNDTTWTMTETVSSTKRPPMMPRTSSCLVTTAMEPSRSEERRGGKECVRPSSNRW